jgi:ribosomal protein S18 acetylase RimI-like enzyme
MSTDVDIAEFSADDLESRIGEFAALLHACVHAGANINFVLPFSQADAEAFWRSKVLPDLAVGSRVVLVARESGRVVGSVQLNHDTPPNQPHRAEVNKLLVHPDCRRRGIARALMAALHRRAGAMGRSLITLDTRTGDGAEPLYTSLGYRTVGVIPDFCLDPIEDRLHPATFMYKVL